MKNDLIYLKASLNNLVLINLHLRLIKNWPKHYFLCLPETKVEYCYKYKIGLSY